MRNDSRTNGIERRVTQNSADGDGGTPFGQKGKPEIVEALIRCHVYASVCALFAFVTQSVLPINCPTSVCLSIVQFRLLTKNAKKLTSAFWCLHTSANLCSRNKILGIELC